MSSEQSEMGVKLRVFGPGPTSGSAPSRSKSCCIATSPIPDENGLREIYQFRPLAEHPATRSASIEQNIGQA
jgi:hypothetical protein